MECTQARRFFLVRVIRHDVVEINLEACNVLFHGTSGSPRLATKVCYTLAKTKLISLFEYTRRQGLLSSKREMDLSSKQIKEYFTHTKFRDNKKCLKFLTKLNTLNINEKFLIAQLSLLRV